MPTLAEIGRERKAQLRQLKLVSRRLDAAQESLEREVNRLINRKRAIPELQDAERLANMAMAVEAQISAMGGVIASVAQTWGIKY